jgi:hypothetical protein
MRGVYMGETDTTLITTMRKQMPLCPGRLSRPYKITHTASTEAPPPVHLLAAQTLFLVTHK